MGIGEYVLGLDSGSVSLKAVLIDKNERIICSSYEKNYDLITTLKQTLNNIKVNSRIVGVGITGTGQEFISKLVGGDIIEPEIVCHYTSAIKLFPEVRTIIDIGGQDSKLILIDKNKLMKNCVFNQSCGAGTGGFIEYIASELRVDLNEVGDLALESKNDFPIAGKCSVFARTSVIDRKNKGVANSDILMGVCKALVNNYFAVLGKGKILEPEFVFQGATAKNKALKVCFEDYLNHSVNIPPYPELMGAYGIALVALDNLKNTTNFKGFDLINSDLRAKTFIAKGCANQCEITLIYRNNEYMGFIKNPKNECTKCASKYFDKLLQEVS
jgi:predicted CoA-substrate-specific enzyme activase